jgi:hypothetical protein
MKELIYEVGNSDLKTEQNVQSDINLEYNNSHFEFFVNGFTIISITIFILRHRAVLIVMTYLIIFKTMLCFTEEKLGCIFTPSFRLVAL